MKKQDFLKKLFVLCMFVFVAGKSQAAITTVSGTQNISGVYDSLVIEAGGIATLTDTVSADYVNLMTGGKLIIGDYLIDSIDAGSVFIMGTYSTLSFGAVNLNTAVQFATRTITNRGIFELTGSANQSIQSGTGFPNNISSLIVKNANTINNNQTIYFFDSIVIYAGAISGGKFETETDACRIENHSTLKQNIEIRVQGFDVTIEGTETFWVNTMYQNSGSKPMVYLKNNMKIDASAEFSKGAYILLNGYDLILGSSFPNWFGQYNTPLSYADFTLGGRVVYELVNTPSNVSKYFAINLEDNAQRYVSFTVSGSGSSPALAFTYVDSAFPGVADSGHYISMYLMVEPINFTTVTYDVKYYYSDPDVNSNENLIIPQRMNMADGFWTESANDIIAGGTNKIFQYGLNDTFLLTAFEGPITNLKNLVVSSSITLMDTLSAYDTVIIANGGIATLGENVDNAYKGSFGVGTLIIEAGGQIWSEGYYISGVNIRLDSAGTMGLKATQGMVAAEATNGNYRFLSLNYNKNGYKVYYGSSTQDVGSYYGYAASIAGIVINNAAGVKLTQNVYSINEGEIVFNTGILTNNKELRIDKRATVTNNFGTTAFSNVILKSGTGGNYGTLDIKGTQPTRIYASATFDAYVDFNLYQNLYVSEVSHNSQGSFNLYGADLYLEPGVADITATKAYKINLNDTSNLVILVDSVNNYGKKMDFAHVYYGGTNVNFELTIDSASFGTQSAIILQMKDGVYANMPDAGNCVSKYLSIDTSDIADLYYGLAFTYVNGDETGSNAIQEGGIYSSGAWDTAGISVNFTSNTITAQNISKLGVLAAGDLFDKEAPVSVFVPANSATNVAVDAVITITFDEPVFNINATTIASPENLIIFKETDASGTTVTASVAINGTYDTIIITPSGSLKSNQLYYVELAEVEDAAGNETIAKSVTFTTVTVSGVEEISATTLSLYPIPTSGSLTIQGAKANSIIEVRDILGNVVMKNVVNTGTIDLSSLNNGMYIVTVDGIQKKVIVKK